MKSEDSQSFASVGSQHLNDSAEIEQDPESLHKSKKSSNADTTGRSSKKVKIKTAKLLPENEDDVVLSRHDIKRISTVIEELDGIVSVQVITDKFPNYIQVSFRNTQVNLRDIINRVNKLGIAQFRYEPPQEKDDIRLILSKEVAKYKNKFLLSLAL